MILPRATLGVVYTLTVLFGVLTIVFPVAPIEGAIGAALTMIYGVLLTLGGLAALIAVLIPNYKIELVALWPVTAGYLCYDVALWALLTQRVKDNTIGLAIQQIPAYGPAISLLVLVILLSAKIYVLNRKSKQLIMRSHSNGRLE